MTRALTTNSRRNRTTAVTDEQIEALYEEATQAGDRATADTCRAALWADSRQEQRDARALCAQWILQAQEITGRTARGPEVLAPADDDLETALALAARDLRHASTPWGAASRWVFDLEPLRRRLRSEGHAYVLVDLLRMPEAEDLVYLRVKVPVRGPTEYLAFGRAGVEEVLDVVAQDAHDTQEEIDTWGLRAPQAERRRAAREPEALTPANAYRDEPIALIYNPKARVFCVAVATYDYVRLFTLDGVQMGIGYLDSSQPIGPCARTHSPSGVDIRGDGYGLALYAGLACLSLLGYDSTCIGSAPGGGRYGSRSVAADKLWAKFLTSYHGRPPLAEESDECSGCAVVPLGNFVGQGIVVWIKPPKHVPDDWDWEARCYESASQHLEALATATIPERYRPELVELVEHVLDAAGMSPDALAEWRQQLAPHLVRNPRGRLSFHSPAVEKKAKALYRQFEDF